MTRKQVERRETSRRYRIVYSQQERSHYQRQHVDVELVFLELTATKKPNTNSSILAGLFSASSCLPFAHVFSTWFHHPPILGTSKRAPFPRRPQPTEKPRFAPPHSTRTIRAAAAGTTRRGRMQGSRSIFAGNAVSGGVAGGEGGGRSNDCYGTRMVAAVDDGLVRYCAFELYFLLRSRTRTALVYGQLLRVRVVHVCPRYTA